MNQHEATALAMIALGWREEPGWLGSFSRRQVAGAIPNGARVFKTAMKPGDSHAVGARATVLGSMPVPPDLKEDAEADFAYFVEWEDAPRKACFIVGNRIAKL